MAGCAHVVDVTAAGRVDAGDSTGIGVGLHAGAAVCGDDIDGGVVVPALHALLLLCFRRVAQPPESMTATIP